MGVSFQRTAMIGRLQLFLEPHMLTDALRRYGYQVGIDEATALISEQGGFAEPVFRLLGAEQVQSFDASRYEGASEIHDFNDPLPERYEAGFDLVLDSGSLEHVFDIRTALGNCMKMVKPDGHLIMVSPANNFFGHGFYQFSPEFFYRAFSDENGFSVKLLALYEDAVNPSWYEIPDPRSLQRRLALTNARPTFLALLAKRTAAIEPFTVSPQESDYSDVWTHGDIGARTAEAPSDLTSGWRQRVELPLRRLLTLQDDLRSRRRMERLGFESLEIR